MNDYTLDKFSKKLFDKSEIDAVIEENKLSKSKVALSRGCNSALQKLNRKFKPKDINKYKTLKYKDLDIDMLPLLGNALSHFNSNDTEYIGRKLMEILRDYSEIFQLVDNDMDMSDQQRDEIERTKLYKYIYFSILPYTNDFGMRYSVIKLFELHPKDTLVTLMNIYTSVAMGIWLRPDEIVEKRLTRREKLKSVNVCCTQYFSLYVSCYWAISSIVKLGLLKGADELLDFLSKLIDLTIPKQSIHYKYYSGKITDYELYKQYTDYDDKDDKSLVSIRDKDIYLFFNISNLVELKDPARKIRELKFDSPTKMIYTRIYYHLIQSASISDNINDFVTRLLIMSDAYSRKEEEINELKSAVDFHKDNYIKIQDELKQLKKTNGEIKRENESLKRQLEDITSSERKEVKESRKKLRKQVSMYSKRESRSTQVQRNLSNEIKDLESVNRSLRKELTDKDRSIKSLTKELEELKSQKTEIITKQVENENKMTLIETAMALQDKRLVICGIDCDNLIQQLSDLGLNNITYMDKSTKKLEGNYDLGVIIADRVKHQTVYKMRSYLEGNTEIIYFNGTNLDKLLIDIYGKLYSIA